MSSAATVSAVIKTDTASSSNPLPTSERTQLVVCGDNGGRKNLRAGEQPESAAVNGVTLWDQSAAAAEAVNLGEGRPKIWIGDGPMERPGIPAAKISTNGGGHDSNDLPLSDDKAVPLSVTNIDEIRVALANACETKKDLSSSAQSRVGGPQTKAPEINPRTIVVPFLDQNNNCAPDRHTLSAELRDCGRGIDAAVPIIGCTSSAAINNGNHVRNNNNNCSSKTIEPRSVINGLSETEIPAAIVAETVHSSSDIRDDKAPISSAIQVTIEGEANKKATESETPLPTKANQFAQLDRRIILGGSAEAAAESVAKSVDSGAVPGPKIEPRSVIDRDQRESAQTRKVNSLDSSTTLGQDENLDADLSSGPDKNQVSERMDPITDSVTAEIVIAAVDVPAKEDLVGGSPAQGDAEETQTDNDADLTEVNQPLSMEQSIEAAAEQPTEDAGTGEKGRQSHFFFFLAKRSVMANQLSY